jgi:hypothetical protein
MDHSSWVLYHGLTTAASDLWLGDVRSMSRQNTSPIAETSTNQLQSGRA